MTLILKKKYSYTQQIDPCLPNKIKEQILKVTKCN